jgi:hypothetical protein
LLSSAYQGPVGGRKLLGGVGVSKLLLGGNSSRLPLFSLPLRFLMLLARFFCFGHFAVPSSQQSRQPRSKPFRITHDFHQDMDGVYDQGRHAAAFSKRFYHSDLELHRAFSRRFRSSRDAARITRAIDEEVSRFAEYKGYLEAMGAGLKHHHEANRHHPEHFDGGVNDMTLVDVIEMVADWKAATERHDDGDLARSLEIQQERFELSDQLVAILWNTAKHFGWLDVQS